MPWVAPNWIMTALITQSAWPVEGPDPRQPAREPVCHRSPATARRADRAMRAGAPIALFGAESPYSRGGDAHRADEPLRLSDLSKATHGTDAFGSSRWLRRFSRAPAI